MLLKQGFVLSSELTALLLTGLAMGDLSSGMPSLRTMTNASVDDSHVGTDEPVGTHGTSASSRASVMQEQPFQVTRHCFVFVVYVFVLCLYCAGDPLSSLIAVPSAAVKVQPGTTRLEIAARAIRMAVYVIAHLIPMPVLEACGAC